MKWKHRPHEARQPSSQSDDWLPPASSITRNMGSLGIWLAWPGLGHLAPGILRLLRHRPASFAPHQHPCRMPNLGHLLHSVIEELSVVSRLPGASTGRSSSSFRGELVARQGYMLDQRTMHRKYYLRGLHNAHTLNVLYCTVLHISVSQPCILRRNYTREPQYLIIFRT